MSLLNKKLGNKKKQSKKAKINEPKNKPRFISAIQKNKRAIEIYLEENNLPLYRLKQLSFSIFDSEVFKKKSICNIDNPSRNLDLYFSLEDPRLGTINQYQLCAFCDKTTEECTGHFARLDLGFNFIHPLYRNIVILVLQTICHTCNKLLLRREDIEELDIISKSGLNRLKAIVKASEKKSCRGPNCGSEIIFKASEATKDNHREIPYYIKKGNEISDLKYMQVDTILTRLKALSKEDIKLLGFTTTHPKDFIMNYIPVLPFTDRPPNITDSEKKDHSLTYAYNDILTKYLDSKHHISLDDREECYRKIISIYNMMIANKKNDPNTYVRNQQEPIEAIKDMINRKDGIIRNNLLGKRCDYTGRSVLGPNNRLNFGYLAPPVRMKQLTLPEIITRYNFDKIKQLATEGKIEFLCPKEGNLAGRKLKFDYQKHFDKLSIGDRIDRMSQDGDVFLLNRAPTLQPQSMLGYKAVFQEKESIGVHLSSTKGLNADFDGDEGNLHVVQTPEAQAEARLVMNVENNIISASNSKPEAAMIYNSVASAFLLSRDDLVFSEEIFNKAIDFLLANMKSDYCLENYKTLKKRIEMMEVNPLSGKSLMSVLFPADFYYKRADEKGNNNVLIGNGILLKGRLMKRHVGEDSFSIVSNIYKNYGKKAAADFISASNFLFNWYIFRLGFTLSFKDCTLREFAEGFSNKRLGLVESANKQLMKMKPLPDEADFYQIDEHKQEINDIFTNVGRKITKEAASHLDLENSIFVMVKSDAKGSKAKAIEIVGSMGNSYVNNELPALNISNNKRWLSTFSVDDKRLQSRGFSINSYFEGMDVDAYFAQCQSGRMGLIDTAVGTASIGYMQRKMVKAQEDLVINYDGSIRNQVGVIFQFAYGPNFKTQEMVLDNSDDNFSVFSFINIKETVGKINYDNGFNYNIEGEIIDLAKQINDKYGFEGFNFRPEETVDEDNEEKIYFDTEGDDFDDDGS